MAHHKPDVNHKSAMPFLFSNLWMLCVCALIQSRKHIIKRLFMNTMSHTFLLYEHPLKEHLRPQCNIGLDLSCHLCLACCSTSRSRRDLFVTQWYGSSNPETLTLVSSNTKFLIVSGDLPESDSVNQRSFSNPSTT